MSPKQMIVQIYKAKSMFYPCKSKLINLEFQKKTLQMISITQATGNFGGQGEDGADLGTQFS